MYLVDRDLAYAIECKKLVFRPAPEKLDTTSIDMHLDAVDKVRIWDIEKFTRNEAKAGKNAPS